MSVHEPNGAKSGVHMAVAIWCAFEAREHEPEMAEPESIVPQILGEMRSERAIRSGIADGRSELSGTLILKLEGRLWRVEQHLNLNREGPH